MRKEELVQALVKVKRSEAAKASRNGKKGTKSRGAANGTSKSAASASKRKSKSGGSQQRLEHVKAKLARSKDLAHAGGNGNGQVRKDRLVVMVRGPYWLHAFWELTRQSVERARVAMGPQWHGAKPTLRISEVTRDGTTNSSRRVLRDIEIHGGTNDWYVDVDDPPRSFQVDIGYLAPDGKFLSITRSNVVTTPQAGSVDGSESNWEEVAEDFDRIYALSGGYDAKGDTSDLRDLFEERLRRPMGSPMVTRFGRGASAAGQGRPEMPFQVGAEVIVYGVTDPKAHVTLRGEPVRLQPDGTFSVRFTLPERRQVLPVVASSGDGVEQRTIVLAIERNTKVMEPVIREPDA
jgi:hypothetical protein